jgi:holliday junction DNA helicase RuvA|uniref:Holliday junction branch migration protein RuvA n=1 Tax=Candidatus Planktophila sp. TaxID=2175601 RepID=UPI00404A5484
MIATLSGTVKSLSPDRAIIEVGGVGMSVLINAHTSAAMTLGAHANLYTSLVVREDSLTLFGFSDEPSRVLFELVQTVSGIGPKVALSILGALTPSELAHAVNTENISAIEKVPGIGKKGAQRLILELKSKISDFSQGTYTRSHQPVWREQLTSALVSLGFSAKDSDDAINSVLSEISQEDIAQMELGELLKLALQSGKK